MKKSNIKIFNIQYSIFNIRYLIFFVLFFVSCSLFFVSDASAGSCKNNQTGACQDTSTGQECVDLWGEGNGWWLSDKNCEEIATPLPPEDTSGQVTPPATKGLKGASGRLENLGSKAGLADTKPLEETIGGFIKGALVLVGTIFLVLMVYGGYIWMIARGDEQEVERAKKIIETAVIGLAIVMAAYAVTFFVVYRLTQSSGVAV